MEKNERHQKHMTDYRRRQRLRGLTQANVWIPADKVDDLHFYAAALRAGKTPADVAVNSIGRLQSTDEVSINEEQRQS